MDASHYEHEEIGFNYRMSNVLAALGRSQLRDLDRRVTRRRAMNRLYRELLAEVPGIAFMPSATYAEPSCWLSVITIDGAVFGVDREMVRMHLESQDIEARPAWKPMHMQPLYADAPVVGGSVSSRIFEQGLCLPSGSGMSDTDVSRVTAGVLAARDSRAPVRG